MRIEPDPSRPGLLLRGDEGGVTPIHPRWLRERLDGPDQMDPTNGQRLYDPSDLPEDVAVADVTQRAPGVWALRFSDGAAGVFSADRLLAEAALTAASTGLPPRLSWTGTLSPMPILPWRANPPDDALLAMAETFLRYGFVILRGVPSTDSAVLTVAETFGTVRDTNFGKMFNVRSEPNPEDLAYTGLALDPHTDNPYRDPVPGVQLLHCLTNRTSGGFSTLVDGLTVLQTLRARDPAAFDILATTPVRFVYTYGRTELVDYAPLVEHDAGGQIIGVRVSPKLEFVPLLPEARLEAFYRARRLLDRMLRDEEFSIRFLLGDGDLMMFDNRRVLHGRTSFDPQEGLRHLQGCYIDIDGPRSLYRVLSRGAGRLTAAAE
jgi:gamma-butyrobetaine dioxygenase